MTGIIGEDREQAATGIIGNDRERAVTGIIGVDRERAVTGIIGNDREIVIIDDNHNMDHARQRSRSRRHRPRTLLKVKGLQTVPPLGPLPPCTNAKVNVMPTGSRPVWYDNEAWYERQHGMNPGIPASCQAETPGSSSCCRSTARPAEFSDFLLW